MLFYLDANACITELAADEWKAAGFALLAYARHVQRAATDDR